MQVGKLIRLDLQKGMRETEKNYIKNFKNIRKNFKREKNKREKV